MKNILAIRFARLGDVILLLPALADIKASHPNARLTLLTGHRCAPIGEMCPSIDDIISVDRIAMRDGPAWRALRDVKDLVADVRSRHFDVVVDFHSFRETNLISWFSRAPYRVAMRRHEAFLPFCFNQPPVPEDKSLHVSDMFRLVAKSLPGVGIHSGGFPTLAVPQIAREWAAVALPEGSRLALYVDAPADDRKWPAERFAAVADNAIERFGARPIVLCSGSGALLGERVARASRHRKDMCVFSDLDLPRLTAAVASSEILISNDTGPMHLGPALGVPTLGLFSVGLPEHFRPTGRFDCVLRGQPIETLSVEDVIQEMVRLWAATAVGRGLRR